MKTVVCALYKFVSLTDYQSLRAPLSEQMQRLHIRGTLLLAHEGINGTIAGSRDNIDQLLVWLRNDPRLKDLTTKESHTDQQPFKRTKVKLKKEIVTMGVENIDPTLSSGTYVKPDQWNQLISDPEVVVVDTRNDYEVRVGTFKHASNPKTATFREFPDYADKHLDPEKHKKVAMFCTGGIRCEKSTAYLKQQGFEEVYHLQGGILKYLEEVPETESLWEGECFVFDDRVTVNHQLQQGHYDQCHACRLPITDEDKASPLYEQGVSCPHCFDQFSSQQKQRFKEREKQIQLAKSRGEAHLGGEVVETVEARRQQKEQERERQRSRSQAGQTKN
ncbi:rhodanese-related sulfurtransferase [Endozoicomonas montiporae]|nr:hypothetical protein EZMO1_1223 [Endozoicomonas montiporae CL-33]